MPRPRASTPSAMLLATLLLAAGPAGAADGFTQTSLFRTALDACLPVAGLPAGLGAEHAVCLAGRMDALGDDADWRDWWRDWGAWTPFAEPDADPTQARLGAVESPPGGPAPGFGGTLALSPAPALLWPGTAPDTVGPGTHDTGLPGPAGGSGGQDGGGDRPVPATTAPPPTPFSVISEPATLALLGGALAAFGLARRTRRPRPGRG